MSRVRVCFLGTPDFAATCLRALLEDEHYEVVGVVTQPDRPAGRKLQLTPSPVKALALAKGLRVVAPESLKNNPLIVDEVLRWGAEIAVVVAFGQILEQKFLDSFHMGCVNIHASLLPRWRGAAPIQRAIEAGDQETGVCLQKMVRKLDAGDVIGERRKILDDQINSLELHDELAQLGADLLRVELMDYIRGHVGPRPQDEAFVTYARKIDKSESLIDWNLAAVVLDRKIRALAWGPGTYTLVEGRRLKIHRARVFYGLESPALPGVVVRADESGLVIGCGAGALEILEVQPESRNRQSAAEFMKSQSFQADSKWG